MIFEHVPKTGGKSLLDAFGLCDDLVPVALQSAGYHVGHAPRARVTDKRFRLPGFTFGIVRHPVEWWRSLWKYIETPGCGIFDIDSSIGHPFDPIIRWIRRGLSCAQFVSEIAHKACGFYSGLCATYLGRANLIGRMDNLGPSAVAACKAAGLTLCPSELMTIGNPRLVNASKPGRSAGDSFIPTDIIKSVESIEAGALRMFQRANIYDTNGNIKKRGQRNG